MRADLTAPWPLPSRAFAQFLDLNYRDASQNFVFFLKTQSGIKTCEDRAQLNKAVLSKYAFLDPFRNLSLIFSTFPLNGERIDCKDGQHCPLG